MKLTLMYAVCVKWPRAIAYLLHCLESRASAPLHLVHSDLWGLAPQARINGARYFALFVDDFSRFSWLYLLPSKDQLISAFIQFKTMAEKQLESSIKILQTDGGGEFQAVNKLLTAHGIIHRVSCPYTSQQNGRVERKHRHGGDETSSPSPVIYAYGVLTLCISICSLSHQ
ncbi:hypothetical protein Scep_025205 [Stephania cephalantha]|uniref:Integrase catalytic domain-containing protein n=1 Tax=Stephania cephalantha TaxID=152367 RepID=A0AAP0HRC2_9MAGN